MYMIFAILLLGFLVIDYFVLSSIGLFGNIFFMIDESGILLAALIFIFSFIISFYEICENLYKIRTPLLIIIWFFGFGVRVFGNANAHTLDLSGKLLKLTLGRTFILFFSIPFGSIDNNGMVHVNAEANIG